MAESQQRNGERNRAVSPVIGVILMVAITVILAAVIGAFVLEIGDQQETGPSTSFDSDEQMVFLYGSDKSAERTVNTTLVTITHAGGETLDISQTRLRISGNDSVWQVEGDVGVPGRSQPVAPAPDVRQTLGTNEKVAFSSGESWRPFLYGGPVDDPSEETDGVERLPGFENIENIDFEMEFYMVPTGCYISSGTCEFAILEDEVSNRQGYGNLIESGTDINVVWTAESGGKTQRLFKYTTQSGTSEQ